MSTFQEQEEYYGAFLSAYEFYQNAIEAGRRGVHEDQAWLLQDETYNIAASNKRHATADELPDLWNSSGTGTLKDGVAVLRWQLMKLESGGTVADLAPCWHDLNQDRITLHFTRFAEDFLRLDNARHRKVQEWEQCNKLTEKEVEETAARTLRAQQKPSCEVNRAKEAAWSSHVSKLDDLRAERDVSTLLVSRTDDTSDLRKELRRLARKQNVECEAIEATAEINDQEGKQDRFETRHSVPAFVTDEEMQGSPNDGVDANYFDEDNDGESTSVEEDEEVSVPGVWPASIANEETANENTTSTNQDDMTEAMEKLDLGISTSQTPVGGRTLTSSS